MLEYKEYFCEESNFIRALLTLLHLVSICTLHEELGVGEGAGLCGRDLDYERAHFLHYCKEDCPTTPPPSAAFDPKIILS